MRIPVPYAVQHMYESCAIENGRAKMKKGIRILANGVERDANIMCIEVRRITKYVGECERKRRCSNIGAGGGASNIEEGQVILLPLRLRLQLDVWKQHTQLMDLVWHEADRTLCLAVRGSCNLNQQAYLSYRSRKRTGNILFTAGREAQLAYSLNIKGFWVGSP